MAVTIVAPRRLATAGDPDAVIVAPLPAQFEDAAKQLHDFLPAPLVTEIVVALVEQHEVRFSHLRPLRIACLWKRTGGRSGGLPVLGKLQRTPALVRHYDESDYTLWMAADHCSFLPAWTFEAAVYHQLCHATLDPESGEPSIRAHDFEGFTDELAAYGPWSSGLRRLRAELSGQLSLFAAEDGDV